MTHIDVSVKQSVLDILYTSDVKLTAQHFVKQMTSQLGISFRDAKKIMTRLIGEQELCYHYVYGSTYIEKSFLKPVQVTPHFILKPNIPGVESKVANSRTPGSKVIYPKDTLIKNRFEIPIDIVIEQGISFGTGQHPTTCLCLEAIDLCFFEKKMIPANTWAIGADIGTGSGVLAVAMCQAGLTSCNAYEIDPISINEAKKNVVINNLDQKITIIDDYIDTSPDTYDVICANLRTPTLKTISGLISSSLKYNGVAILSGLRDWEKQDLIDCYQRKGLNPIWEKDKKHWSGVMFVKN
ncbi:MAG: 50S ribosomal protein L11 methyltransferase [Desulfobacula sp.]|nr:50S ribosomal protein L11 methyltransferase [Desulfobacula sp.]